MHKSGQRVEFKGADKKLLCGTVDKVQRGTVRVIGDDGSGYSGPEQQFAPTNRPLPADHPSRKFAKGDRVEFDSSRDAKTVSGTVRNNRMGLRLVLDGDDGMEWQISPYAARPSKTPGPKVVVTEFAKGDRVEGEYKNKTVYGVVVKGGAGKISVTLEGGDITLTGAAAGFRASSRPLPAHKPNPMDRWTVASYKTHDGLSEETICFEGTIARNGKVVIYATNNGHGGCNMYRHATGQKHAVCSELDSDAKAWAASCGAREPFDVTDMWLAWVTARKPFDVTGEAFWNDLNRMSDRLKPEASSPSP